jgi:hypothetical protein
VKTAETGERKEISFLRHSLLRMNVLSEISHCSVNVCNMSRHF